MKNIIITLIASVFLLSGCNKDSSEINNDTAYLFYSQTCPHCHEAREYINQNYPDLDITQIDVASKEGSEMLLKCAKKFDLGNNIGVPLFCLGDKHIMGWSSSYRIKFDAYIRPFLKK